MNKLDLITAVADQAGLTRNKAAELVDTVLDAIAKGLRAEGDVRLMGFGSFTATRRPATRGRNPRTGAEITIPPTTAIKFKPGKALKDLVQ